MSRYADDAFTLRLNVVLGSEGGSFPPRQGRRRLLHPCRGEKDEPTSSPRVSRRTASPSRCSTRGYNPTLLRSEIHTVYCHRSCHGPSPDLSADVLSNQAADLIERGG